MILLLFVIFTSFIKFGLKQDIYVCLLLRFVPNQDIRICFWPVQGKVLNTLAKMFEMEADIQTFGNGLCCIKYC